MRTERTGERSSLDSLSRTIEGLESRLSALMTADENTPEQRPEYRNEVRRSRSQLEEEFSRSDPPRSYQRRDEPMQSQSARVEMQEIGRALRDMRVLVRQDFTLSLKSELSALHEALSDISERAGSRRLDDETRTELARIAGGIDWLITHQTPDDDPRLMAEFDHLKELLTGLASSRAVERVEMRVSDLQDQLRDFSPQKIDANIAALSDGLTEIGDRLDRDTSRRSLTEIEGRLTALASAMEKLCAHYPLSERRFDEQFYDLGRRIEEIGQTLSRLQNGNSYKRDNDLTRIEQKLSTLSDQVSTIERSAGNNRAAERAVIERLEAHAYRLEQLGKGGDYSRLESRVEQLTGLLERQLRQPVYPAELSRAIEALNGKIDRFDPERTSEGIIKQLSALDISGKPVTIDLSETERRISEKLDAIDLGATETRLAARFDAIDLDGLEGRISDQLSAVAKRLENKSSAGEEKALERLQQQVAELTTMVSRPAPTLPLDDMERRIGERIDGLMASNDDYIIEAARHAAEEALRNHAAGTDPAVNDQLSVLSALVNDLKQLETISRSGSGDVAISDIHATLNRIAGRLDTLEGDQDSPEPTAQQDRPRSSFAVLDAIFAANGEDDETRDPPVQRTTDGTAAAAKAPVATAPEKKRASLPTLDAIFAGNKDDGKQPATTEAQSAARATPEDGAQEAETADVLSIISRVRAQQLARQRSNEPPARADISDTRKREPGRPAGLKHAESNTVPRQDLIAAARRAARSATSHSAEAMNGSSGRKEKKDSDDDSAPAGKAERARFRRPVFLAVGAVLLAILALPTGGELVSRVLKASPEAPSNTTSDATPAAQPARTEVTRAPAITAPATTDSLQPGFSTDMRAADSASFDMTGPDKSVVTGSIKPDQALIDQTAAALGAKSAPAVAAKTPRAQDDAAAAGQTIATTTAQSDSEINSKTVLDTLAATAPEPSEDSVPALAVPDGLSPAPLVTAAKAGDPRAFYEIAGLYQAGTALPKDPDAARNWFEQAAAGGLIPADFQLGSIYEKGIGTAADPARAVDYYRKAAEAGNVSAMHNLAVMLANGASGTQNFAEADRWFEEAANHGVSDSQFNLAILYARGAGMAQDLVQSYKWFAIAAEGGDKDAASRRDEVAAALSKSELAEARKAVQDFHADPIDTSANTVDIPSDWQQPRPLSAEERKKVVSQVQNLLNQAGFDAGPVDGLMGAKTAAAVMAYQRSLALPVDGDVTPELLNRLKSGQSA
ncbi:peptidoglycan-binding protein [Martelella sp. HB161492]|uniref:peptidoglycan-binding protein n=1 Tax=Martelella sp. HB161492 TaxID=2720726 RepID=UPI0015921D7C|nr:peptidoglycan-binding protein [Martelella sp. HB161492]